MNQASIAKSTEDSVYGNQNFLTASPITKHNINELALKLSRHKENSSRYVSHKDFISQCIKIKLVPKRLELILSN